MSIGQAGKRAQQFSTQHQRRHTVQYNGGSSEPLVQRAMSPVGTTSAALIQPISPLISQQPIVQRATDDETNTTPERDTEENTGNSAIQNPNRGANNTQRMGRSSEAANVDGEEEKQLNADVIADKVYEILLRENRDYSERIGKRLRRT